MLNHCLKKTVAHVTRGLSCTPVNDGHVQERFGSQPLAVNIRKSQMRQVALPSRTRYLLDI
jgi:hypothetical protein